MARGCSARFGSVERCLAPSAEAAKERNRRAAFLKAVCDTRSEEIQMNRTNFSTAVHV